MLMSIKFALLHTINNHTMALLRNCYPELYVLLAANDTLSQDKKEKNTCSRGTCLFKPCNASHIPHVSFWNIELLCKGDSCAVFVPLSLPWPLKLKFTLQVFKDLQLEGISFSEKNTHSWILWHAGTCAACFRRLIISG